MSGFDFTCGLIVPKLEPQTDLFQELSEKRLYRSTCEEILTAVNSLTWPSTAVLPLRGFKKYPLMKYSSQPLLILRLETKNLFYSTFCFSFWWNSTDLAVSNPTLSFEPGSKMKREKNGLSPEKSKKKLVRFAVIFFSLGR